MRSTFLLLVFCLVACGQKARVAVDPSWVGSYMAGDGGDNGIALDVLESGTFEAWVFSCGSDARLTGRWSSDGDWIAFQAQEIEVDRGEEEDFSLLPRMRRSQYEGNPVLLPDGDEKLLERETWRIIDVYSYGDHHKRKEFLSHWFAANPLGG
ncbi:MAG: hypothetical protein ACPG31_09330 [Planctomycetota bacterium]